MSKSYLTYEIKKNDKKKYLTSGLDPDRLLTILYLYFELSTYFMTTCRKLVGCLKFPTNYVVFFVSGTTQLQQYYTTCSGSLTGHLPLPCAADITTELEHI